MKYHQQCSPSKQGLWGVGGVYAPPTPPIAHLSGKKLFTCDCLINLPDFEIKNNFRYIIYRDALCQAATPVKANLENLLIFLKFIIK
jgi:hypothetical protein